MGVFFNKKSILHELEIKDANGNPVPLDDEDENNNPQPEDAPPEDNNGGDNNDDQDANNPDDNTNNEDQTDSEPPEGDTGDPPTSSADDEEEPIDYGEGAPEDTGEESDNEDQNNKSNNNTDGNDDQPNPDSIAADLMDMENKLLSELTPEQIQIKHQELKKKYIDIYDTIDPIINRISNLSKDNTSIRIYDFVTSKLTNLRELVSHYLIKVYPTKTYIENLINYEEYIAILHQIDKILEQIPSKNE